MADRKELKPLRYIAKRLARWKSIPLHQAQDIVAKQCGHPHWNAMTKEWNKGWRPDPTILADFRELNEPDTSPRGLHIDEVSQGEVQGEPYELRISFDEVLIRGQAWAISLGHAPSEAPKMARYSKPNALDDDGLYEAALVIVRAGVEKVREAIWTDWPARSATPDASGVVEHPLFGGQSAEWHCLHCDEKSSGAQMVANMWHCPKCSATPIDMHPTPWWNEEPRELATIS